MDNSSKSFWCYLLFFICCYYPFMLRLNLIKYFASVRYYKSFCTAAVSDREVLHREPESMWRTSFHSWRTDQLRISITRTPSDTLAYFYVQYPKRVLLRFNRTCYLSLTKLLWVSFILGIIYLNFMLYL